MTGAWLYVVVALSGASVLAIEILGTRLLGPFYGVGLFLWSALISVTLAALSLGYALGGRLADRGPTAERLAWLLGAAGTWVLLVPWMRTPLLTATESLGLRAAVLVTSFLLFFPPLTLLGMVSPFAIRMHATRLDRVGSAAGNLYAVSTVASVAAALLTGFWLIPAVGVTRLTFGTGVILLLTALIAWFMGPSPRPRMAGALLLLLPGAGGAWQMTRPETPSEARVVFAGESPYAEIRVVDKNELRYLLLDGGVHTIIRPGTPQAHHPYVHVADLARELFQRPGRILIVGLGGGAAARGFAREGWQVDAVEIDARVTRVAREYFGLRPTDAYVHTMDGRRYLAEVKDPYDVIFLDAFGSSAIPFHLVTAEAFALARSRLRPGGVLILNVESVGWRDVLVGAVGATLSTSFPHVLALPIAEPPDRLGNVVLLASDREMQISLEALGNPVDFVVDPYLHWVVVLRNHAWSNRFPLGRRDGQVITDDLSPVDVWADRINLVARRELHEMFRDTPSW